MRFSVAVAVSCLVLTSLSAADQAAAAIRKQTNITAQGLGPALHELAKHHEFQILYRTELIGDRRTTGAVGELTLDEALTKLLSGTNLTFHYLDDKTITILRAPASGSPASSASPNATSAPNTTSFWDRFRLAQAPAGNAASDERGITSDVSDLKALMLEEIVVTAQKRTERLQDVPISISVLGGDDLERSSIAGATEALSLIPGAKTTVGFQGGGTQVSLRGVAANGPLFNGSSTVGYYIDSAPFGLVKTAVVPDSNVYDLERIEVLRGPQGTLYGASALNGVVRILTHPADLDKFEFKTRASASSIQDGSESYRGDMAVNVPIVEGKLAARAVLGYEDVGGWIDRPNARDANDGTLANARLKINARPIENLSIGLSAWLSRADYDSPPIGLEDNTAPSLADQPLTTDYDVFGLQAGYEFPGFALSSATTYLNFTNEGEVDLAPLFGVSEPIFFASDFDASVLSQELLLNSTHDGAWQWSAGIFYRDAEDSIVQVGTDFTDTSKSVAVFGELTRKFFDDRFEITGGLRYFEDEVTQRDNASAYRATDTFDAVSPRVVLTWLPNEALTVYTSYSEGFRSGFNQNSTVSALAPEFPPLKEDTLRNYEIGAKGGLLEGKLTFDAAVYFIDWQDVQQSIFVQTSPGIATAAMINGESASGAGIDLAVSTRPIDGLILGISASWNDLTLDDRIVSGDVVLFEKGDRLNVSAEETYGAMAEYAFGLGGDFEARLSISGNYTSEPVSRYLVGFAAAPAVVASDDQLLVRAGFAVDSGKHWTLTFFGDNLNKESGSPSKYLAPFLDTRVRPRTIGFQFDYRL